MSASVTAFDQLKSELENEITDYEKVRQIISANNDLLKKPIGNDGEYVLHFVCWKNAPSNIVIEFINGNTLAVQQLDNDGWYPLHYACRFIQSELVIQLLVKEYPLAVQQKTNYGYYPLHLACMNNQSESVIRLLIKEYPLAVQQKANSGDYPLHFAYMKNQSESVFQLLIKEYPLAVQQKSGDGVYPLDMAIRNEQCENLILKLVNMFPQAAMEFCTLHAACKHSKSERLLLVLINLSLHTVKYFNKMNRALAIAKRYNQSSTIIKVLEEVTTLSNSDLQNGIGIPKIVTLHALDNLRRHDTCQWLLNNSPILIDGKYIFSCK
jgi:uncharacterized protein